MDVLAVIRDELATIGTKIDAQESAQSTLVVQQASAQTSLKVIARTVAYSMRRLRERRLRSLPEELLSDSLLERFRR